MNKEEIKSLLNKNNPVILEIGTNDGEDSEDFLKCFENIQLYCFEPDPRAIYKFKNRMSKYKNYKLYEVAISNYNGYIDFYLSGGINPGVPYYGDWDKSSSIKKPKLHLVRHQWCKFTKTIRVESIKLDDWYEKQNIDIIDFIWLDVQGAEKEFIEGATKTLEKTRYLYTEFDNIELYEGQINLNEILKILKNFKIIKFVENNVLLKNVKS